MRAAVVALALALCCCSPAHAAEPFGAKLEASVAARCLVVGDSNLVAPAFPLLAAMQSDGSRPAVVLDFAAAIPGTGLRDLEEFAVRLSDPRVAAQSYDCAIINLGVNDLNLGLPEGAYVDAVGAMLALLPDVPIYWIGVPTGPFAHPWGAALVNISIACHDTPSERFCPGTVEDPRLHYIHTEGLLEGWSDAERFLDGIHYTTEAALTIFGAVRDAILEDAIGSTP